jgi:hypothetical protein
MLAFFASHGVKVSAFAATLKEEIALSTTLKEPAKVHFIMYLLPYFDCCL